MTTTRRRLLALARSAASARRALGRARRGDGALRRRADGDGRLPDLARRRAPGGALADGRDRRACASSASRGRSRATSSGSPRTTSRSGCSGRARVRVYERIEPLAPAELEGYRRGDLLARMVADVDALQNLHLRGVGPPLVALVAGRRRRRRHRRVPPGRGARARRRPARRPASPCRRSPPRSAAGPRGLEAAARGELTAELVEPVARRAGARRLRPRGRAARAGSAAADRELVRLARRAALADGAGDGLRLLVTGRDRRGRARRRGLGPRRGRPRPRADRDARAARARRRSRPCSRWRRPRASWPRRSPPGSGSSS